MNHVMQRIAMPALICTAAALWLACPAAARAADEPRAALESPQPTLLNPTMHSKEGFKPLPPWPSNMVIWGDKYHAWRDVFGGEFTIGLYEASDGKVTLVDQPYDELVQVVRGECILTPKGGGPRRFRVGDVFVVPKGFSGTWEGRKRFRELVVVETKAYNRAMAEYFGPDKH